MSNFFDSFKKYRGSWQEKAVDRLDAEDLMALQPTCVVVKGTWGRSFKFTTRVGNYDMYIPADISVTLPVNTRVPIEKIAIVTICKDGEDDKYRARVID